MHLPRCAWPDEIHYKRYIGLPRISKNPPRASIYILQKQYFIMEMRLPEDPPPHYVAGYYMSFDSVHTFMSNLGIHDREMRDPELYHPVNNWLAEHGRKDILACTMPHPTKATSWEEDGMIFMTHITLCDTHLVLPECDEKDERVKRWLVDECGLKADELEWHRFFDKYWLTLNGTEPRANNRRRRPDPVFVTDEDADEWEREAPHLTINEYIAMRQEKERAKKKAEK